MVDSRMVESKSDLRLYPILVSLKGPSMEGTRLENTPTGDMSGRVSLLESSWTWRNWSGRLIATRQAGMIPCGCSW
jgi:hypothetical protein